MFDYEKLVYDALLSDKQSLGKICPVYCCQL